MPAPGTSVRDARVFFRNVADRCARVAGFGSYFVLGIAALISACTESRTPTGLTSNFKFGPATSARLAVGARVVYLGAAKSAPVNFLRLRVYEEGTTTVIGTLDQFLDPKVNAFDFNFVVALGGRKLNGKTTMELATRDSVTGVEVVRYSGRVAQTTFAPGDIRQLDIDLYPGPLSNLDVTAMHLVKPIAAQIEGDSVRSTAVLVGAASDTRVDWSSLDENVASVDAGGMVTTKLPGTARIVAAVGAFADTVSVTVKQRLVGVTITPTTASVRRGDSTTFVAKPVDVRGTEIAGELVTWSVPVTGIVALTPSAGRVVGQRIGTSSVTATSVSKPTLSATAAIVVGAPAVPVASITVSPSTQTATAVGQTKSFAAEAKDAAGNTLSGVVFQWSSSATGIATVDASGVATAVAAGTATITASVEEAAGTATLLVRPPGIQLQVVSGSSQVGTVKTSAAAPVVAKVTDASGSPVAGVSVTFATADVGGSVGTSTTTTSALGLATSTWSFGTKSGAQAVTATSAGLVNSPLSFTATVAAGAPNKIAFVTSPSTTSANRSPFAVQPVVEVQDEFGNPVTVAGTSVTVAVASGGGTLTNATVTTDGNGRATFSGLSLAGTVGARPLSFSTPGLPAVTAPVSLTAGAATSMTVVSGNSGSSTAGTLYQPAPVVQVFDADGNPVSNTTVTLTPSANGSSVQPGTVTTDASGKATISGWTLRSTAGADSLSVSTPGSTPIKITATAVPGSATQIAANGGSTTGTVGAAVAVPPSVIVRDANGNPVVGVTVTFSVSAGGGTITGGTAITNSSGVATVGSWTLGTIVGTNTLAATSGSLSGSPVSFSIGSAPGVATQLSVSGGSTSGQVGQTLAVAPSVVARDAFNNPVPGVTVTFAVASGGGSATGLTQATNAQGVAVLGSWTLGPLVGANTLTATSGTLGGSPLTIAATGLTSAATQMALNGGSTTGTAGALVAVAPSVIVRDASGNPVAGVPVTFAVGSGGGSITGVNATSNGSGVASLGSWTLGTAAGANTVIATSPGLTNSPLTITVTGGAGAATQLSLNGGSTAATVNTAVAVPPSVVVRDANNNPVAGITVTFAVTSGGGSITGATAVTNANGVATLTSWTLGATAGVNTLTASSTGLTNSPLTISASSVVTGATQMALNGGSATGTAGQVVAVPPSVVVKDASNNPVAGVLVSFAVTSGGGTVTGATQTTNAQGVATVGAWTLGATAGTNTIVATSTGLANSPLTISATASTAPATQIASYAGSVAGTVGAVVATNPAVIVKDAAGNPVAGVDVTFAVTSGGGSMTGVTQKTNAQGIATVGGWTLGTSVGTNTATATSAALTGSPVTFSVTSSASTATTLVVNAGNAQSAAASTAVPTAPSVKVTDQYGNAVPGVAVTFAATTGGGSVTGGTQSTNASGIATVGSWTLGASAGLNTLTVTSTGLGGSPLAITATGTSTGASLATSTVTASPTSITADGTTTSTLTIQLKDAAGNNLSASGGTLTVVKTSGPALTLSAVTDNGNGTYTATVKGTVTGTATFTASLGGNAITNVSNPVTVTLTPGAASLAQSTVTASPTSITADGSSHSTLTVQLKDAQGNSLTASGGTVTMVRTAGTGTIGAVTDNGNGTYTATLTSGVAAGSGSITASLNGSALTNASNPATVTYFVGTFALANSTIAASPTSITADGSTTSTITVQLKDASGNNLTSSGGTVTIVKTTGPALTLSAVTDNGNGTYTATVKGSVTGTATFTASVGGSAITNGSNPVTVTLTPGAASLANSTITASPTSITADGSTTSTLTVQLKDAQGNNLTASGGTVTIVKTTGPTLTLSAVTDNGNGTYTATVKGSTTGTATFTASVGGSALTNASNPVTVTLAASAATKLAITTQPSTSTASGTAFAQQPVVTIQDAAGNTVTSSTAAVTLTLSTGTGTLSGTTTVNAVAGVATFSGLSLNLAGTDKVLTASSGALTTATTSPAFTITAGAATKLAITTQPSTSTASGTAFAQQPVVTIQDAAGNTVTSSTAAVTLTLSTGTGTLSGTTTVNAVAGVATFSGLSLNLAGTDKVLTASSGALTTATTSPAFTITAGAASAVTSTVVANPSTVLINSGTSTVTVQLKDAAGNSLTASSGTITFATPSSGTITGVTNNNNGTWTATYTAGGTGTTVTIQPKLDGVNFTNTASVTVSALALAMSTQPAGAKSGAVMTTQPVVQLKNNGANDATAGVVITAAIATQPGSGAILKLSPTAATATATTDNNGVATFSNAVLAGVTGNYTIQFTATSYASITSNTVTLAAGSPFKISWAGPDTAVTNAVTEPFTLTLQDSTGNAALSVGTTSVNLSNNGSGTFYSDAAGTTVITSIPITTGNSTATVYYKETVATPTARTLTAAGTSLTSGTYPLYIKSAATASQRLVCVTNGNPNNSSNSLNLKGCSAITTGTALYAAVSVSATVTISAPSGWTQVGTVVQGTGTGSEAISLAVFKHVATSAADTGGTSGFTFSWTGNKKNVGQLVAYKDSVVNGTITAASSSTGSTTATTGSVTPTTAPSTALYFFAFSNGVNGGTWTTTSDIFIEGTVAGNSNSSTIVVADIDRKTQTTYQGRTAGNAGLAASTGNATMVVVLGRNP